MTWKIIALAALLSAVLRAQSEADLPKFEIADVHVNTAPQSQSSRFVVNGFYRDGRYEFSNATMVNLITKAYGVDADKVFGGPSWLDTDRFDVVAKAPPASTQQTIQKMLQQVLAERFGLTVHSDKRELPTFALRAGKKLQMKESDGSGETGCKPQAVAGDGSSGMLNMNGVTIALGPDLSVGYVCRNVTMAGFADALHTMPITDFGPNPPVDETELKGAWDFTFRYSLVVNGGNRPGAISIPDALDKIGLKRESVKAPLPVLVVDSVSEKPTANPPGVAAQLPVVPKEFEVADVKPTDPNAKDGPGRGGRGNLPGGRVEYRSKTLLNMILDAWDLTADRLLGAPKFLNVDMFDILAKAPAAAIGQPSFGQTNDPVALRLMMQALLVDRFQLKMHPEERTLDTYVLLAVKPKLKKADPASRTNCKDGPGADGKDPRIANPALGRLVSCQNMTVAQLAQQLPFTAGGYFQTIHTVVDETHLEGGWDFTLNFSPAGFQNGGGRGGRGGDAGGGGADASDPGQGLSLADALDKQLGLKMDVQKRPMTVWVIDHVEQKPTDN